MGELEGNIYLEAAKLVVTATVILREGNYFANKHTSVQLDKNTKNHEYTNTNTKRRYCGRAITLQTSVQLDKNTQNQE